MEENKLEQIDNKLNSIFEEILWLERRLDDRRNDEREKELRKEEEELRRKREDIAAERMLSMNHYEEKCDNFRKGCYY